MNDDARLERLLADGLYELAPSRVPDRTRTHIKAATSDVRSHPRWLALIKERPMRTNSRLAVGSPTVRVAAIAAATMLAAVLVASAAFAGAQLLAADDRIVVDQEGGGHYTTITEAVAAAGDGDTVLVRPGTYVEAVVIDKDITLQGDGPVEDIIVTAPEQGPTSAVEQGRSYEDPYAFLLDGSEATLSGLTFKGEPSEVFASGGAPMLEGLVFDGVGVAYDGSQYRPVSNTIVVNDGSAATVRGNTITGGGGIGVFDASAPLIEDNLLSGESPHIYGFRFGDGALIRGNRIEAPNVYGIVVTDRSGDVVIEGNTITDPGNTGIYIVAGTATIRGNHISGARGMAINVHVPGAIVVGNELTDNQIAISFGSAGGVVAENVVRGGKAGIAISSVNGAAVEATANDVESASGRGLAILGGSPVLRDNRSCSNGENLFVADRAAPDINDSNEICEPVPAP